MKTIRIRTNKSAGELLRRFLEKGPRSRMTSANRKVVICQHCHLFYSVHVIGKHEDTCSNNLDKPRSFKSLGKKFLSQKRPEALDAPDIRIACVVYGGKSFPVLLDDAVLLFEMQCLIRTGSYRYRGLEIKCFRTRIPLTEIEESSIWGAIVKARKMGARLVG